MAAEADPAAEAEENVHHDEEPEAGIEQTNSATPVHQDRETNETKDRSGGTDHPNIGVEQQCAKGTADQRGQVHRNVRLWTDHALDLLAELPQQVHVEANVDQSRVKEPATNYPPPVATIGDGWPIRCEVYGGFATNADHR